MLKIDELKSLHKNSLSVRLFSFLIAFVIMMVVSVVIVLLMTGKISSDLKAPQRFAEKEFSRLYNNLNGVFGNTTIRLTQLSQLLSRNMEYHFSNRNIPASKFKDHPEILEEIIGGELSLLKLFLERSECSGVFLILDATVNPALPNAQHSKAGIYIRRMEPDVPGSPEVQYFYYRGFPGIAYRNGLFLQATWDMEFNVENFDIYHQPMEKSAALKEENAPVLSRLFYWNIGKVNPRLNENSVICSIPIATSNGEVFGVCGFEISEWNFAVNYLPDNSEFSDILCLFSKKNENTLNLDNYLISGNPISAGRFRDNRSLDPYMVLQEEAKMYSSLSPFADQIYTVSLLISDSEINAVRKKTNIMFFIICASLITIGVGFSIFITRRYLKPITSALDGIQSGKLSKADKTKIAEIDELIAYISNLIEERNIIEEQQKKAFLKTREARNLQQGALFDKLNTQELRIAELSLRGLTYMDIAESLKIKPNTVKWYQKILYSKLGINSKFELFELAQKQP